MAAMLALLASPATLAADFCKFYSNLNWTGSTKTYDLPDSESYSGYSWGAIGIRRIGSELSSSATPVYKNAESVRIRAYDSDVVLYVFDGDHFDGKFQAVRVSKGNEAIWNYGSMRNAIRSFICQRDDFIPASFSGLTDFLKNSLLPSYVMADPITAMIHEAVLTQKSRFYSISLKRGRLS
jgi:hypothetical protein